MSQRIAGDTLSTVNLEPVVVTATRTERSLNAVPLPITVIGRPTLRSLGSLRLNEALAEQPGLVVVPQVNAQGNGLQLQGFNPDYTLILIDGEPLIGRYTGSLELSRITTGNIRQIEVVKGPVSSLYGSEALAGVVNIITEEAGTPQATVSARYGTNSTSNLSLQGGMGIKNLSFYGFADRYSTGGYHLSPERFGKTVSPFTNHTLQSKIRWKPFERGEFTLSGRWFAEQQDFAFEVKDASKTTLTDGQGIIKDWNIAASFRYRISEQTKLQLRYYKTAYSTKTNLYLEPENIPYYRDDFQQTFSRPEVVLNHYSNKSLLTVGAGAIGEEVATSRYGDRSNRNQFTLYGFAQEEWTPMQDFTIIAGIRLDQNSIYGSQISPKLSLSRKLTEAITIKASSGVGFKAPDFRQLYFNFNNAAAGGYSVLGSEVVSTQLKDLEDANRISRYYFDPKLIGALKAERSLSFNAGADVKFSKALKGNFNFFRNNVGNLIETQIVASTIEGQNIYTYRNIRRAMTEGLEAGLSANIGSRFRIQGGYQLLFAGDRDVMDQLRKEKIFYRDPETLVSKRLMPFEYHGLYNRSRNHGTIQVFFMDGKNFESSFRMIYRSRFGIGDIQGNVQGETIPSSDVNANSILDRYDRFVPGYFLLNWSASRKLGKGFTVQTGIDNLLNFRNTIYIPNIPGRLWWISATFNLKSNKHENNK